MVVLYTHMCQKEEGEGEKMLYEVIWRNAEEPSKNRAHHPKGSSLDDPSISHTPPSPSSVFLLSNAFPNRLWRQRACCNDTHTSQVDCGEVQLWYLPRAK